MGTSRRFRFFTIFVFILSFALVDCGGGPSGPATTAKISGTVSGTEIIAVDDSGDIVASDDTTGKTADVSGNYPFTLTGIPTGVNIRVYLITGSGVYPLYFDSDSDGVPDTNVFSLSAVTTIDLGFVDTAVTGQDGRAIPENDPTDTAGVSAQAENTAIPAKASLVGTWGFGRLKHRNSGTWAAKSGKFVYNADGTGSTVWQENDNNTLDSGTSTWTWTVVNNTDGSITLTRTFSSGTIKTRRIVISDDGMVMILDGTDQSNKQRYRIAVRMDPAKTYSNADTNGVYYFLNYLRLWDGGLAQYYHGAQSGEFTPDGAGNYSLAYTANFEGTIVPGSDSGTYSVSADGTAAIVPVTGDPAKIYLSGDGGMSAGATSGTIDSWTAPFGMEKADRTYATTDLAGTWAFMSFQDNNNGMSYASAFGTMNCLSDGNCTANAKFNRDGTLTIESDSPPTLTVQTDGSFGTSYGLATPAYAATVGNDGNVIIMNPSFEDTTVRRTIIGVRCSTCAGLENGGPWLTQLTNDSANDSHPYWNYDGTKIVFQSNRSGNNDIWIMNANGTGATQLTTNTANDRRPYWSPDGTQIVFHSDRSGNEDIWIMNADGTGLTPLTTNSASDTRPTWSPDGTRIAFQSNRDGNFDIWTMNTDGTGLTKLTTDAADDTHPMWKPDGTRITFARTLGSRDIWVMNADGSNQQALTIDPADEQHADWSPDGTKIAFRSDKKGNYDVWVMAADGSTRQQITTHSANDRNPDWSPDGTKIMFRSDRTGNNEIWIYTLP